MPRKKVDIKGTGVGKSKSGFGDEKMVSSEVFQTTIQVIQQENEAKIKKFKQDVATAQFELKKTQADTEERLKELEKSQSRVLETIGIFAALLSFIAFEAQIFKGPLSTASLVGVSSIIFGALVIFILLLDMAFDAFKMKRNLRIGLFCLAFFCILAGFFSAYIGYKSLDHKEYYTKEEIDVKIENTSNSVNQEVIQGNTTGNENDRLLEFKNCILKQGLYKCL